MDGLLQELILGHGLCFLVRIIACLIVDGD